LVNGVEGVMVRVEFGCPDCKKRTSANTGALRPGQKVRCKHCGTILYERHTPAIPNEIKNFHQWDLSNQPIEFMTCDRCGERFNKRQAKYDRGTVFCPKCQEEVEI
jgi:DNA-directed RNA polymerase subunit RPC12/RpoP